MRIQIEPHTLQSAVERGTTGGEIIEVPQSVVIFLGKPQPLGKSGISD